MNKIIAVQDGLDNIANRLRNKGYHVTNLNGTYEPVDAIIFSGNIGYRIPPSTTNTTIPSNNQFVVMLNADELEEEEIINRIDAIK